MGCLADFTRPFIGICFILILLSGLTSIGAGIYGLVTIASSPTQNTSGFAVFCVGIVAGVLLIIGVTLGFIGLFRHRNRMTRDRSGWVNASTFFMVLGGICLAALACVAVYGYITWLEDPVSNSKKIWDSLASPAIEKIQKDYNCLGFAQCQPYLNNLVTSTYKIGAIVTACCTAVVFLCILLLCGIRANRAVVGRAEAQDVERAYIDREKAAKSSYDAILVQKDSQINQMTTQISQKDNQIAILQRRLDGWTTQLPTQMRESFMRGVGETEAEMTAKWTQREREIREQYQQQLTTEYERGANEAEMDLQHQWLERDKRVTEYWQETVAKLQSQAAMELEEKEKLAYLRGWEEGQAARDAQLRNQPSNIPQSASAGYLAAYGLDEVAQEVGLSRARPYDTLQSTPQAQSQTVASNRAAVTITAAAGSTTRPGVAVAPPRRTAPSVSQATLSPLATLDTSYMDRDLPPVPTRASRQHVAPTLETSVDSRPLPRSTVRWTEQPDGTWARRIVEEIEAATPTSGDVPMQTFVG